MTIRSDTFPANNFNSVIDMANNQKDDPLAYGDFHQGRPSVEAEEDEEYQDGERGIVGDAFRKLRSKYQKPTSNYSGQNVTQTYQPQLYSQSSTQPPHPSQSSTSSQQPTGLVDSLFNKLHGVVHGLGSELKQSISGQGENAHSHTHAGAMCSDGMHDENQHRYDSFAAQRNGNDVKWYVDGCGYMWAVSKALEQARQSIWILDCRLMIFNLEALI